MTHPRCGWAHGRVSGDPGNHEREAGPHSASREELPAPSAPRSLAGWDTARRAHSLQRRETLEEQEETRIKLTGA